MHYELHNKHKNGQRPLPPAITPAIPPIGIPWSSKLCKSPKQEKVCLNIF